MQYNHEMKDIVYHIRSHLAEADKQRIKTSNPEMLEDLAEIYAKSDSPTLLVLIESLMQQAGDTWTALLHRTSDAERASKVQVDALSAKTGRNGQTPKVILNISAAAPLTAVIG